MTSAGRDCAAAWPLIRAIAMASSKQKLFLLRIPIDFIIIAFLSFIPQLWAVPKYRPQCASSNHLPGYGNPWRKQKRSLHWLTGWQGFSAPEKMPFRDPPRLRLAGLPARQETRSTKAPCGDSARAHKPLPTRERPPATDWEPVSGSARSDFVSS